MSFAFGGRFYGVGSGADLRLFASLS
ncbi:hypothetical protein MPC4_60112 [Methylocella tundrae]|uniref:Uncharacterized protein n=1 Tax=Methylocella tundrae TaxID=227605 RepID=A0A8B6MAH8_METTU|nr:hypothetical protein MPC4_60112 [Methylocella tundrae]